LQPVRPLDFGTWRLCLVKSETLFVQPFPTDLARFPCRTAMCGDSKPNNNRKRATARTGNIMLSKDEQINSSLHPLTAQRKLQKSCSSSTKDARKSKEQIPLFLVIPKMRNYRPSVRFDNQLATERFDFHKIMPLTTKCHRDIPSGVWASKMLTTTTETFGNKTFIQQKNPLFVPSDQFSSESYVCDRGNYNR
jgi:hypothetical protein